VIVALTFVVSLILGASGAQAVVVDFGSVGAPGATVPYSASNLGNYVGLAMVPGTSGQLATAGVPTVQSGAPCADPALSPDLILPSTGLCSHGGAVMHANETFALTWDPNPHSDYAAPYVEQFLRDVADASGTFSSPFAVTPQYTDASGRAGNSSLFGGGYHDATSYPSNGCTVSGTNFMAVTLAGIQDVPNDVCLTDAQLRTELAAMVTQNGLISRAQPGHSPLLVMLTPPGVETCLDAAGKTCSANADPAHAPAQFCSYHSQLNVGGNTLQYVVQPWSPITGCDEPDAPKIVPPVSPSQLIVDMGARLVSPLSRAALGAIVNPGMNGWYALDGSEMGDNGCVPLPKDLDKVSVGGSGQNPYVLQRAFNNGGAIVNSPNSLACTPGVVLQASFVVPSAVNQGDVVQLDGSKSPATLVVPSANYVWDFGDGTTASGPSLVHSYGRGGNYTVKLTVTDRGNNVASVTQTLTVLGASGAQPPTPTPTATPKPTNGSGLQVHLQLMPQSLGTMLRSGVTVRVSSNEAAAGIASLSIPRLLARRAHLSAGRGPTAVIARGTVSGIQAGTMTLHLRLPRATAAKLRHLRHVTVTVRLALVGSGGDRLAIDAAGRY
jgi:hypothetical protein